MKLGAVFFCLALVCVTSIASARALRAGDTVELVGRCSTWWMLNNKITEHSCRGKMLDTLSGDARKLWAKAVVTTRPDGWLALQAGGFLEKDIYSGNRSPGFSMGFPGPNGPGGFFDTFEIKLDPGTVSGSSSWTSSYGAMPARGTYGVQVIGDQLTLWMNGVVGTAAHRRDDGYACWINDASMSCEYTATLTP